eukprot:scaffold26571_cov52-Attheya_sp.AAC.7
MGNDALGAIQIAIAPCHSRSVRGRRRASKPPSSGCGSGGLQKTKNLRTGAPKDSVGIGINGGTIQTRRVCSRAIHNEVDRGENDDEYDGDYKTSVDP